ncbi:hypothetical protein A2U01_0085120, partial [Trifolium medium]|nr:hypothetical protein [Trifolium medium]
MLFLLCSEEAVAVAEPVAVAAA